MIDVHLACPIKSSVNDHWLPGGISVDVFIWFERKQSLKLDQSQCKYQSVMQVIYKKVLCTEVNHCVEDF